MHTDEKGKHSILKHRRTAQHDQGENSEFQRPSQAPGPQRIVI